MSSLLAPLVVQRPDSRRLAPALELAHAFLPQNTRQATVAMIQRLLAENVLSAAGLFAAYRGGGDSAPSANLVGAIWGEVQAGRSAAAQPPQLSDGEPDETALLLLRALEDHFLEQQVSLYQVQLEQPLAGDGSAHDSRPPRSHVAPLLETTGLRHASDLLFLASEAHDFPHHPPSGLEFEPYRNSERRRLAELLENTYRDSLDLPELDGLRSIDDVIEGHRHTGVYRHGYWRFVRRYGRDVGCLLLCEHPPHGQWELAYMGLVPEARGRGWGATLAQYGQYLVGRAGGQRLLLAVDVRNTPALRSYGQAGFQPWRRRAVYLKSLPATAERGRG